MAVKDQGRSASEKAYETLAPTRETIAEALTVLRAVDPEKTVLRAEVSEMVGQLEALYLLVDHIVPRLADMATSEDWMGHG